MLAQHFLGIICEQHGKVLIDMTDGAAMLLRKADWTGNIRELRNVVERLVILTPKGGKIDEALVKQYGSLTEVY